MYCTGDCTIELKHDNPTLFASQPRLPVEVRWICIAVGILYWHTRGRLVCLVGKCVSEKVPILLLKYSSTGLYLVLHCDLECTVVGFTVVVLQ